MITESQKKILKAKIKKALRESMFENDFFENNYLENMYPEGKRKEEKEDREEEEEQDDPETQRKRSEVMTWLKSKEQLHSVFAYKLWPEKDEDEARSLFSKKYRGKDNEEHKYSFNAKEINDLFNMKYHFIDEIT